MKKTRNLFILTGSTEDTSLVLNELRFKGMLVYPYGVKITDTFVVNAFKNNKSVACSKNDYMGKLDAVININIANHNSSILETDYQQTIFVDDGNIASQFANIADSLNCDIGDHKSNSSGLSGAPTVKDCAYCRYLAGFPADNERTVYGSKNFFVLPTIGQFITGYLLVIPYEHVMSNAELDSQRLEEFKTVLQDIEYILKLTYNASNVLVWENGSGNGGVGKAKDSIVHSHVHICPSQYTSEKILEVSGFPFETITLESLKDYKEHSYLLVRTPDHNVWKINNNPDLYIPRQYVRQLVAEEYGLPGESWNWRTHHFSEKMYQTVEDIRATLLRNWNILPERIKNNTSFLF